MGAWGPGIFANDTACDARDSWRAALDAGDDPAEATARILRELAGGFDDTDLLTGLAAAQHETGHLQEEIRERALAAIERGSDLELWDEGPDRDAREAALAALADDLRGAGNRPTPPRRRLPPPDPGVEPGDVLRIWSPDRGRSALFYVAEINEVDGNPWPALIGLFNVDGSGPSLGELSSWRPSDDPLVVICAVTRRDPQFGPAIGEIVARGVRLDFDADLSDENAMTDNHVSFPYLAELLGADSHDVRR